MGTSDCETNGSATKEAIMILYLVQHGEAKSEAEDPERLF